MNVRIAAFLAGAVALGLLALACTADTVTTVLPAGQDVSGISVSGTGSTFGEPDVALLSLGVEAEADTVGEARAQAAEAMNAMLQALKDGGVAEEDLQTTRFSVQPRFDFTERTQVLIGFVVTNTVTAKVREIDDTGQLLDDAITAGGDLTRVNNVRFTIDDPSALEDAARVEAVAEARRKAQTLADAAGVELGAPISISESGGLSPFFFEGARTLAIQDEFIETPIELGELEVSVSVQIVYSLGGE